MTFAWNITSETQYKYKIVILVEVYGLHVLEKCGFYPISERGIFWPTKIFNFFPTCFLYVKECQKFMLPFPIKVNEKHILCLCKKLIINCYAPSKACKQLLAMSSSHKTLTTVL